MAMRPPEPPNSAFNLERRRINKRSPELYKNGDDPDSTIEKVIFVPTNKVGYLIGYQGRTITGFERTTGAKIDILEPNSSRNETPVTLQGTRYAVRHVIRMITDLYDCNNYSSKLWTHPNSIIETVQVEVDPGPKLETPASPDQEEFEPGERKEEEEEENQFVLQKKSSFFAVEETEMNAFFAAFLIGNCGQIVEKIEQCTGAKIIIKPNDEKAKIAPVQVMGTAKLNARALEMLQEEEDMFLQWLEGRTYVDGPVASTVIIRELGIDLNPIMSRRKAWTLDKIKARKTKNEFGDTDYREGKCRKNGKANSPNAKSNFSIPGFSFGDATSVMNKKVSETVDIPGDFPLEKADLESVRKWNSAVEIRAIYKHHDGNKRGTAAPGKNNGPTLRIIFSGSEAAVHNARLDVLRNMDLNSKEDDGFDNGLASPPECEVINLGENRGFRKRKFEKDENYNDISPRPQFNGHGKGRRNTLENEASAMASVDDDLSSVSSTSSISEGEEDSSIASSVASSFV